VTTRGKYEVLWPGHVNAMNQSDSLLCRIIILRYDNYYYYCFFAEENAKDAESLMIFELRRIFFFDEQKARDSNALKELKILLKHHIPQSLHGHGKEFDEIFESLVHDGKIQFGNYSFLHDFVSKIDPEAAKKIEDCQEKIKVLREGMIDYDIVLFFFFYD
jgi:hypothetical protein